jgi:hypothetical protein
MNDAAAGSPTSCTDPGHRGMGVRVPRRRAAGLSGVPARSRALAGPALGFTSARCFGFRHVACSFSSSAGRIRPGGRRPPASAGDRPPRARSGGRDVGPRRAAWRRAQRSDRRSGRVTSLAAIDLLLPTRPQTIHGSGRATGTPPPRGVGGGVMSSLQIPQRACWQMDASARARSTISGHSPGDRRGRAKHE